MIEFRPSKVDKKNNNTPILKDAEIDELAEAVLRDYKPHLLKEPRKIKYEHFLESYLGANLRYNHIYYEKEENRTFGATAFNLEKLKIFDKENLKLDEITLQRGSVVIDLYVTEEGREGLELFTGLHEGGHLWLHQGVYTRNDSQVSLFDIDPQLDTNNELPSVTCCRRKDIEIFGDRYRKRTAYQWREHQADYFASAIAMPKSTFVPLVQELLKSHGIDDGKVVEDAGFDEMILASETLPSLLMQAYGVSKKAAYVKLKKFGFVVDQKKVKEEKSQLHLF